MEFWDVFERYIADRALIPNAKDDISIGQNQYFFQKWPTENLKTFRNQL